MRKTGPKFGAGFLSAYARLPECLYLPAREPSSAGQAENNGQCPCLHTVVRFLPTLCYSGQVARRRGTP